jgi:hypothetical protein
MSTVSMSHESDSSFSVKNIHQSRQNMSFSSKNGEHENMLQRILHPSKDYGVSYPPLLNIEDFNEKPKEDVAICGLKVGHMELRFVEWILSNLGSLFFIIGSYYFLPDSEDKCGPVSCELPGALLFVFGSFFFTIASITLFIRNDAWSCTDMGLTINGGLYIFANILFVIGSYCFIPAVIDKEMHSVSPGVVLFVIGSVIFFLAPMYDVYRTHLFYRENKVDRETMITQIIVGISYIGGSFLFTVGSILYLPGEKYSYLAAPFFLIGSFLFLIATLCTSVMEIARQFDIWMGKDDALRDTLMTKTQSDSDGTNGASDCI